MEVKIEKLDYYGRGIAYIDNKIVFINNALPGEIVEIKIVNDKKRYSEANVLKYIKKSEKRNEPKCQYYSICGGCDLMHMNYEDQLEFKLNKVKEIVTKHANIQPELVKKIIFKNEYNYRNKVVLKVKDKVGYYKKSSNDVVYIDECLIADSKINEVIKKINSMDLYNINEITIRKLDKIIICIDLIKDRKLDDFIDTFKEHNIIKKNDGKHLLINGNNYITTKVNNLEFRVSIESFFQVNNEVMYELYNKILNYIKSNKNSNVLDLFCGTGTIALFISNYSKEVIGIEVNSQAINDALVNKEINYIKNVNFILGDVEKNINNLKQIDTIIVDPPRSGLTKKTIDHILNINPKSLIYVSCDPLTLARDINLINNYDVDEIVLYDMFPNTYHVESLVLLTSKEKEH